MEGRKRGTGVWAGAGFTLIELVVAMGIMAVLGGMLSIQFMRHMDMHMQQKAKVDTQQQVRTVLGWMEDEFRMAGFNPTSSSEPVVGVVFASATHFAFSFRQEDAEDKNGVWEEKDWKCLDYYIDANDKGLRRKERKTLASQGSTSIILSDARLNFVYLDRHQNVLPSLKPEEYARIRAVRIELGAVYKDRKGGEESVDLVTTVKCRNLGIGS